VTYSLRVATVSAALCVSIWGQCWGNGGNQTGPHRYPNQLSEARPEAQCEEPAQSWHQSSWQGEWQSPQQQPSKPQQQQSQQSQQQQQQRESLPERAMPKKVQPSGSVQLQIAEALPQRAMPRRQAALNESEACAPRVSFAPALRDTTGCTWCNGQDTGPLYHHLAGRSTTGQRKWREGAGLIALRENCGDLEVLLVNTRKPGLGFPKGGRKGKETALQNGHREWLEETGLDVKFLDVYPGIVLADAQYGCHYFLADWTREILKDEATFWKPPHEDPTDNNPVVQAQWLSVKHALQHKQLSPPRKALLSLAQDLASQRRAGTIGQDVEAAQKDQRAREPDSAASWGRTGWSSAW